MDNEDIIINMEQKKCWLCPKGRYTGKLIEVINYKKEEDSDPMIRLVFEIMELSTPSCIMLVGKNYKSDGGFWSDLQRNVESWVGREFMDNNQGPNGFSVSMLKGRCADLKIAHKRNPERPKPFVYIKEFHPENTWSKMKSDKQRKKTVIPNTAPLIVKAPDCSIFQQEVVQLDNAA